MAAFDKIESGIPNLDVILDHIRLGDNVVWQVSDIGEFRLFAEPFARQAVRDGRDVTYIRFAQHPPLLGDLDGIRVVRFDPDAGFERFTVAIREEITRRGRDAFYVFDCLSELQSVWYTDLMMGNFFRVTCPYLFELDTVAYFPLLRGRHSFDAVARIRDTTQLLLDVCSNERYVYLHPLKVWNRYSERMFLPHAYDRGSGDFFTVENGVDMSRYYRTMQHSARSGRDQNVDSHDLFFNQARLAYAAGQFSEETEDQIIDSTMTKDERLRTLVKRYFKPEDYFLLRDRMIGSGAIGGKACGMLLARKIAETEVKAYAEHNEPHDSFYIGSDVFYTYIVSNGDWTLRIAQRSREGYFEKAPELRERLLRGRFPPNIRDQFQKVLDYFGQSPFIVRSSSFLEDGFGNAFAGKYESVFCVNQGSPEERMEGFEQAVRRVYASTMDPSALEYRRRRGLDRLDEQMAVLVQRVSGSYYESPKEAGAGKRFFMPGAAGVGYSHSAYKWLPNMDAGAGMLRLVMGLGTKAVDRTKEDYPRLANLDRPLVTIYSSAAEKHRYSQRFIDVLDCRENRLRELPLDALEGELPLWYKNLMLEHDYEAENLMREWGRRREILFISCEGLLRDRAFTSLMQQILQTLERVYGNPVDIEYCVNMDAGGEFVVNLLQCRPLYQSEDHERVDLDQLRRKETFFEIRGASMGGSEKRAVDVLIQIDPALYNAYPYARKGEVAKAVGRLNGIYRESGKNLLLLTPGRIGTSSPELGVPVAFGDISNMSIVIEAADSASGFMPELSYGSHMFQDLVESRILYGAIFGDRTTLSYAPHLFDAREDLFPKLCPDYPQLFGMIRVRETADLVYCQDAVENRAVCALL